MPRTYLNEANKLDIVELRAQKLSILKISKKIKKNYETIKSFLKRFKKRRSIQNRTSTGRPRKVNAKTPRRLLRHTRSHRRDSVLKIQADLGLSQISPSTINRTLLGAGLKSYKPTKKPHLTVKQRIG